MFSRYQPLTTLGTDQDASIVIARIPVLTNTVAESVVAHIASPNRLVQDASAKVTDSNLILSLGATISAEHREGIHYSITLDLAKLGDPARFEVTKTQLVEAVIECIRKTINETHLFHRPDQSLTWDLKIRRRTGEDSELNVYERTYEAEMRK